MKEYISGYSLNPKRKTITFEEDKFCEELDEVKMVGYEFPHYFNENGQILKYRAIIIQRDELNKKDIERIQKLYNIVPNNIFADKGVFHFVFYFVKPLGILDFKRVGEALSTIYDGEYIDYHFYNYGEVSLIFENDNENNLVYIGNTFSTFSQVNVSENLSTKESDYIFKVNKLDILEVLAILYKDTPELLDLESNRVDTKLNIHTEYGSIFNYILKYFRSLNRTRSFFNDNFGFEFELTVNEIISTGNKGISLREGGDIGFDGKGYISHNAKGDIKTITDFFIKVFYKIVGTDGKTNYIISLVNSVKEIETPKIVLTNKTAANAFGDFCQEYGDFHFFGTGNDVKQIHNMVSALPGVMEIKRIVGYGDHKELGLIFFFNGIWGKKNKMFIEKPEEEDYYEGLDGQGYEVVDGQGNKLKEILGEYVPALNTSLIGKEELIDTFNKLYHNEIGDYLLIYFLGYAGFLAYGDTKDTFPMLFLKGTTGSGKTVANGILQTIIGVSNGAATFGGTSVFVMNTLMSYLIKFPIFLSEYREKAFDRSKKVDLLRSAYDKTSQPKGRADQTLVKYDLTGVPMLEGEEMIKDGATRTRTIQVHFKNHKHKSKGNFTELLKESKEKLQGALFDYLLNSEGEKYEEYTKEGVALFQDIAQDSRILDNISKIYAGAMCYMSEKKDYLIKTLKLLAAEQKEDQLRNSTGMQIIKILAKLLRANTYTTSDFLYIQKDKVIIVWQAVEEYVARYRLETSLTIDEYKYNLEAMGYPVDFIDTGDNLIEGISIEYKDMRKEFLVNPDIYLAYKNWTRDNNINI